MANGDLIWLITPITQQAGYTGALFEAAGGYRCMNAAEDVDLESRFKAVASAKGETLRSFRKAASITSIDGGTARITLPAAMILPRFNQSLNLGASSLNPIGNWNMTVIALKMAKAPRHTAI